MIRAARRRPNAPPRKLSALSYVARASGLRVLAASRRQTHFQNTLFAILAWASIGSAILPTGEVTTTIIANVYETDPSPTRRRQEVKRPRHSDGHSHSRSRHGRRRYRV